MPKRDLFANNRKWARQMLRRDPLFFRRMEGKQKPDYFWIGCSDSRVPANQILGLAPGEMFVHRNVANVVVHSDMNFLSAAQFAVEILRVRHIIVCGHYGCGGVLAVLRNAKLGLIDNWLRDIQDVRVKHEAELAALRTQKERFWRLCELNVMEQASNVEQTTIVQDARKRRQRLEVHAWIYDIQTGLLRDLGA